MYDLIRSTEFGDWLTSEISQARLQSKSANPECVNDFATPCFMNLRYRVVLFQSASFALVVG